MVTPRKQRPPQLIESRCHRCKGPFTKINYKGLQPWLCMTPECAQYQLQGAVYVEPKGESRRCVYVPTPKGRDFELCQSPNILFGGARGGSKSYTLRWTLYKLCMQYPRYRALLIRDKLTELKTTHYQEGIFFEQEFLPFTFNKTDMVAIFDNGSMLQFGHLENLSQYLSTQYDTIAPDELVTMPEGEMLLLFTCTGRRPNVPGGVRAATNPGGKNAHWIKRRWLDQDLTEDEDPAYDPAEYTYIPSMVYDNPYISPSYVKRLLALPEDLRKAYLEGDWNIFPGQFFTSWRTAKHVIEPPQLPPEWKRYISMDWGYNSPGCVLWVCVTPDGRAIVEDEFILRQLTIKQIAQGIVERNRRRGIGNFQMVADTDLWGPGRDTGEHGHETFARYGLSPHKASKDRVNGWARLREWLSDAPDGLPWLQVTTDCPYTIRTIPAQVMDENRPEDVDTTGEDHAADTLRYFAMARPATPDVSQTPAVLPGTVGWLKREIARKYRRR